MGAADLHWQEQMLGLGKVFDPALCEAGLGPSLCLRIQKQRLLMR